MWDFRSTFQSPSPCCVGADGHGFLNLQVWKPVHGKLSFTFIQGERKVPLHLSEVGYGLEWKARWQKCWKWHPRVLKQALHTCQPRCFYVWDLSHFQHSATPPFAQGLSAYPAACSLFPPFMCVGALVYRICKYEAQSFRVVITCFKLPYVGLVRGIGGGGCVRNSVEKPRRKCLFGRSR